MAIKDRLKKSVTKTSQKTTKKTRIRSGIDVVDFFEMSSDITGLFIYDNENIYTDRNGVLQKENELFDVSIADLIRVIVTKYENNFVSSGDSYIIETENGTVINILSKPYLHFGSFISFQKKQKYDYSLNTLLKDKVLSVEITSFLKECLVNGQNIFVVGNSSIDKRPILSYLSELVFENLAIIEGVNDIYTSVQNALIFSKTQLPFKELISKAFALSHNFVVAQCDDIKELMSVFEYINMGYKHFVTSFCANSKEEMLSNLKNTIMLNYPKMNEKAINNLVASSVDIVVFMDKSKDGKVRITDVSKLISDESGLSLQDIYKFDFSNFVHENILINKMIETDHEENHDEKFDELFSEEPVSTAKPRKKAVRSSKKTVKEKTILKKKRATKKTVKPQKIEPVDENPAETESFMLQSDEEILSEIPTVEIDNQPDETVVQQPVDFEIDTPHAEMTVPIQEEAEPVAPVEETVQPIEEAVQQVVAKTIEINAQISETALQQTEQTEEVVLPDDNIPSGEEFVQSIEETEVAAVDENVSPIEETEVAVVEENVQPIEETEVVAVEEKVQPVEETVPEIVPEPEKKKNKLQLLREKVKQKH